MKVLTARRIGGRLPHFYINMTQARCIALTTHRGGGRGRGQGQLVLVLVDRFVFIGIAVQSFVPPSLRQRFPCNHAPGEFFEEAFRRPGRFFVSFVELYSLARSLISRQLTREQLARHRKRTKVGWCKYL